MKDIRRVIFRMVKLYELTGRARLGEVATNTAHLVEHLTLVQKVIGSIPIV